MDKTKTKLAAFFNDDDDEPAFPVRMDTNPLPLPVHAHQPVFVSVAKTSS